MQEAMQEADTVKDTEAVKEAEAGTEAETLKVSETMKETDIVKEAETVKKQRQCPAYKFLRYLRWLISIRCYWLADINKVLLVD